MVRDKVRPYSRHEDYTCGEQNRFLDLPVSRLVNGEQWHILSYLGHDRLGNYLGAGWGQPGVRYSKTDLIEYVAEVNRHGGVVSIDVLLYRDGALDGYATRVQITLSSNGKTWQTVAAADNLDGRAYAVEFSPVQAQFVRVSGLKPDGPDQHGAQMAVAELEVNE